MSDNQFGDPSPNPYQSSMPTPAQITGVKPVTLTVFGILNLVFAIMGLCGVGVFLLQLALVEMPAQADNPILDLSNRPAYRMFTMVHMSAGAIATIVLLIGGVGLLQGKPYGRKFSIGWAIYAIVAAIVATVFTSILLTMPMIEQANTMPEGPEKIGLIGGAVGASVGGVCGIIYPIVLLIFMMRGPIVSYMRAQELR